MVNILILKKLNKAINNEIEEAGKQKLMEVNGRRAEAKEWRIEE